MSGAARWFCPSASRRLRDCLVIESDNGRVAHPRRGEGGASMITGGVSSVPASLNELRRVYAGRGRFLLARPAQRTRWNRTAE